MSKTISSGTPSGTLLVDFGNTNGADVFGVAGWSTGIRDVYTENRSLGAGGAMIVFGDNPAYNFQGVSGTARSFAANEKIVVTWYHNSGTAITFRPGISLTDPNRRPSDYPPVGAWYDMTSVTIPPYGTGQTQFVFTSSTAGNYSLVNVNNNLQNNQVLICDKIELVGSAPVQRTCVPSRSEANPTFLTFWPGVTIFKDTPPRLVPHCPAPADQERRRCHCG